MNELQSSESLIADNKINIHKFADVSPKAELGQGVFVGSGAVIGPKVIVGPNTWIGPNVILDGSGGLEIGDYVSISAGVQIYTHNTVKQSTSLGKKPIEKRIAESVKYQSVVTSSIIFLPFRIICKSNCSSSCDN